MKDRKILIGTLLLITAAFLAASAVLAFPSNRGIDKAKEVSSVVTDEGVKAPPEFVADLPEGELSKVVFIRYAPGKETAPTCGNTVCEPKENWKDCPSDCSKGGGGEQPTPAPGTACYDFLAGSKPRWNWVEDYSYSSNDLGTSSSGTVSTWDAATTATIFGNGTLGSYPWGVYDYKNAISYGDYPDPNVIAVTAIWFRGKNIYEYDIMFDTNYFPGDSSIDLNTVTLHEFGHGAGLADLYQSACSGEVMYGYYQGVKTVLGPGDIAGIQALYGN